MNMQVIPEPTADTIFILDTDSRILKVVPTNSLPLYVSPGDSVNELYRNHVSASQLEFLNQQIRAARLTRQSTSSLFDLTLGNISRKFLASFWALEGDMVIMIVRAMAEYPQTLPSAERRHREMMIFNRLAKIVLSDQDPAWVLDLVMNETAALIQAKHVSLLLAENNELVFAAVQGENADKLRGQHMPANTGIAGDVLHTGKPIYASAEQVRARAYHQFEQQTGYIPQTILAAPLRLGKPIIGVIEVVESKPNAFTPSDLQTLDAAANWAAIAVANAHHIFPANED
ncbi:MAG: GAF domain-containing protein [Chloroflexi bacterium]|nr:GAF domain-containing protein [Chloroflexota bacterium]